MESKVEKAVITQTHSLPETRAMIASEAASSQWMIQYEKEGDLNKQID